MASAIGRDDKQPQPPRQQFIWQIVRSRQQCRDSTEYEVVRDDVKDQGAYTPNFSRDVQALIAREMMEKRDDCLFTTSQDEETDEHL